MVKISQPVHREGEVGDFTKDRRLAENGSHTRWVVGVVSAMLVAAAYALADSYVKKVDATAQLAADTKHELAMSRALNDAHALELQRELAGIKDEVRQLRELLQPP